MTSRECSTISGGKAHRCQLGMSPTLVTVEKEEGLSPSNPISNNQDFSHLAP